MDEVTAQVYESQALRWERRRSPDDLDGALRFAARLRDGAVRVDLGCGPGFHADALGGPLVAVDGAFAMLELTRSRAPGAALVQADLEALPFRAGAVGGAWAAKSYLHVARDALPFALAQLHWALDVGAPVEILLRIGSSEGRDDSGDFPGRYFSEWQPERVCDVLGGAGFEIDALRSEGRWCSVEATRMRSLPDTVGPGLRLLVCGLNPSVYAANAGVGFARPGNRFWPAAIAAGLVSADRDPIAALRQGVGMTDLAKRATARASSLSREEYRSGLTRVERLVRWLEPAAVCFVGLAGWRAVVDRSARSGQVPGGFGGRPAYLMPSTSGANASSSFDELVAHLRASAGDGRVGSG